jgi:NAD(P)H-flavin reductase
MVPELWEVRASVRESADTVTLTVAPLKGEAPPAAPGQFNMLSVFGHGEVPISFSGALGQNDVRHHTIRAVGDVSTALARLTVGDVLGVRGPFGRGWDVDAARGHDVVVMAGGIGLAPLKPVIHAVLDERDAFGRLAVLYGVRSPADMIFIDEIEALRQRPDMKFHTTVDAASKGWTGHVGVVTELVPRARFDPLHTTGFVCGPDIMMRFGAQSLVQAGVDEARVQVSLERNMKCAIGHCGHCQYGATFVCTNGPVVTYPQAAPLFAVRGL